MGVRGGVFITAGEDARAAARGLPSTLFRFVGERHLWSQVLRKFWMSRGEFVQVFLQAAAARLSLCVKRETLQQQHRT